jgi:uncharacterized protein (TIGR02145 family)
VIFFPRVDYLDIINYFANTNWHFMMKKIILAAVIISSTAICKAQLIYTFKGNGKWSDTSNWLNQAMPPSILPKLHQIIIDPVDTGQCILDVPQYLSDSAQITVRPNRRMLISGNLLINKSELQSNVLVVDTAKLTLISDSAMLSQGIYKFTSSDSLPTIGNGHYIMGFTGEGYIRKVTGATYARASGARSLFSVLFTTVAAKITDVIKNGTFFIEMPVDNSLQGSPGSALTVNIPTIVFPYGPFSVTLSNANIVLDPKWLLQYNIVNSQLNYLELACKNATLNTNFQVTAAASQAIDVPEQKKTLKTFSKTFSKTFFIPTGIGPLAIPVQLKVVMNIDLVLTYSASASAAISKMLTYSSNKTWDFGIKYANAEWQPFYNKTHTNNVTISPTSGDANLTVNIAIGPKISFKLYGVIGPSLSLDLATQSLGNIASPSLNWDFIVKGWLKTVFGFDATILGNNIIDYAKEWNTDTLTLYATPDSVISIAGNDQSGAGDQFLPQPIKIRVVDSRGNQQANVPVSFSIVSGGGMLQDTSVFTDNGGYAETRWKLGTQGAQRVMATVKKADGTLLRNAPINFTATVSQDSTFIDPRDGQVYRFKHYGTQVWMIQNLNYQTPSGSWCYGNNSANCSTYGRLYDWFAALNAAPPGWHLPSDAEWTVLANYVNNNGGALKDTLLWNPPNVGATNSSGFKALPAGFRNDFGSFINIGNVCWWWSSTQGTLSTLAFYRSLSNSDAQITRAGGYKYFGFSVRCIRN